MNIYNTNTNSNNNLNNYNRTRKRGRKIITRKTRSLSPKKFKSRRNIRSQEPRINYERLGKGEFGEIHRPPYPCADNKELYFKKYASHNYVSKFMDENAARTELSMAYVIKDLIPDYSDYYCLPEFQCKAAITNVNRKAVLKDTLLIIPYCGISLIDIVENKSPVDFTYDLMLHILKEIHFVINGIQLLHNNKIIHNDLHLGNLMLLTPTFNKNYTNPKLYQILISDFGLTEYLGKYNMDSIFVKRGIREDLNTFVELSLIPLLSTIYNTNVLKMSSNKYLLNLNSMIFRLSTKASRLITSIKNSNNRDTDIEKLNSIIDEYENIYEYIEKNNLV
jgi:serine/threonine protein kinase